MAAWRKYEVNAARHSQEKRSIELRKIVTVHGRAELAK